MRANEIFSQTELDEGKIGDTIKTAMVTGALAISGANAYDEVKSKLITPEIQQIEVSPTVEQPAVQDSAAQAAQSAREEALYVMALTMWGEAREHGQQGMRAVGHVIVNRAKANRPMFGEGIRGVALKRKQFSCWNKGDPNREAMGNIASLPEGSPDHRRWEQAKRIAQEILTGRDRDPTGGALFYHTIDVEPSWARGIEPIKMVADHVFYRDFAHADDQG